MDKILVLVGPTASGKSELAVQIAKKFNGEIISCDSRQIYRGLDLGTGKVTGRWLAAGHPEQSEGSLKEKNIKDAFLRGRVKTRPVFIYKSVPHHLIDFIDPHRRYSASAFQKQAKKIIKNILKRGKLPILCGGTAHWIDAVVYNQHLPEIKPNLKLRAELEKKSTEELFHQLKKLDSVRAASIDAKNPRRLIRALEIVINTGRPVPPQSSPPFSAAAKAMADKQGGTRMSDESLAKLEGGYNTLWIGIKTDQSSLYKKIDKRLKERLKTGMIKEVEDLHKRSSLSPLSWKKLESFGLEYKYIAHYLQKKLAYDEMRTQLSFAIKHYSKRQLTWWKRNKEIKWINNERSAVKMTKQFLAT